MASNMRSYTIASAVDQRIVVSALVQLASISLQLEADPKQERVVLLSFWEDEE